MFTWHAHDDAVTALAFGPEGRFLVSAGTDECVKVWDPLTGAELSRIVLGHTLAMPTDPSRALRGLVVSRDGTMAAVYHEGSGLGFLDLIRGQVVTRQLARIVITLGACPDGDSVVALVRQATSREALATRYILADGTAATVPLLGYRPTSCALAFSPDGTFIAIGTTVYPWPPSDLSRGYHVHTKGYTPEDLAFSADNRHLFALVGGKIVVYALPDGLFKTKLKGHDGRITALALAPDGRRLWTASRDATVKCWDTFSLTLDRTYTFQTGGLDCLAVAPDGNVAAVGSGQKGTITLWDLG